MSQTAWILGASAGIGKALAKELACQGYQLVLSARSEEPLTELLDALPHPNRHRVVTCDVSSLESVHSAFSTFQEKSQKLDLVIYLAGIYQPMLLKDYDHDMSLKTLEVNLTGAFNVFEVLRPQALDPKQSLHLVWTASVAGYRGLPSACAYGVSKAALLNFAEIQRLELSSRQTKVQVINPGFVQTRLTDKNNFAMPMIITPEKAAGYIVKGLGRSQFEIAFPRPFVMIMKLLRLLPFGLYERLMARQVPKESS